MRYLLLLMILTPAFASHSRAQGCVAIRSTGGLCTMDQGAHTDTLHAWLLNVNNRYFKSFRHFVGTNEQKQRVANGTEVINHSYTLDLNIVGNINKRWSVAVDFPIIANTRSSLYEHRNVGRFSTHSFGIGDVRLAAYAWLINPYKPHKGNIQMGLGIKLPTGDYDFQDYFHTSDSTRVFGPVDQSIQLGDGGTGFTLELNGYYNISHAVGLYGNFFYLSNPREQNGVSTARGGYPSAMSIKNGSDVMSVPDQYMLRAGANIMVQRFVFSAGLKDECLPVHDLIGGSNGFRRPGYIISAEPGMTCHFKNASVYAFVPVALVRSRTQSVPDKITTALTGKYTQGDAAFADYVINIGCSFKL